MLVQEYKVVWNNTNFFFFKHSFKSAREHAMTFINKNGGKLYRRNYTPFGETWLPER